MRKNKHFFRRENKSLRRENRENLVRVFQSSLCLINRPGKMVIFGFLSGKFIFHQFDELFEIEGNHRKY
ncbi:hypothetical protein L6279_05050, partial [Candidatus Parcubacteria bacterium]|nr:hypothetical protein [Candidatus Parcubacteria bacterium]